MTLSLCFLMQIKLKPLLSFLFFPPFSFWFPQPAVWITFQQRSLLFHIITVLMHWSAFAFLPHYNQLETLKLFVLADSKWPYILIHGPALVWCPQWDNPSLWLCYHCCRTARQKLPKSKLGLKKKKKKNAVALIPCLYSRPTTFRCCCQAFSNMPSRGIAMLSGS